MAAGLRALHRQVGQEEQGLLPAKPHPFKLGPSQGAEKGHAPMLPNPFTLRSGAVHAPFALLKAGR
ncbi:hypothetical protein YIM730264_08620 [Thermus hydrothermalis]